MNGSGYTSFGYWEVVNGVLTLFATEDEAHEAKEDLE